MNEILENVKAKAQQRKVLFNRFLGGQLQGYLPEKLGQHLVQFPNGNPPCLLPTNGPAMGKAAASAMQSRVVCDLISIDSGMATPLITRPSIASILSPMLQKTIRRTRLTRSRARPMRAH